MGDFCWQCTERLGAPGPGNDLALPWPYWPNPAQRVELCEGCGWCVVDRDGRQLPAETLKLKRTLPRGPI